MSVSADIQNIDAGLHGFHVHQYGTLDTGCGGAGGHYNPTGVDHASWDATPRHVGDLQQLNVPDDGSREGLLDYDDPVAGLFDGNQITGRAIVIHAGQDDLGLGGDPSCSSSNGCAGPRVGCGIITASSGPTVFMDTYFETN